MSRALVAALALLATAAAPAHETWLVVIGASLFAAFPMVYAVFLGAFYIPVLLLLFGLIFRGIAFELLDLRQAGVPVPLQAAGDEAIVRVNAQEAALSERGLVAIIVCEHGLHPGVPEAGFGGII